MTSNTPYRDMQYRKTHSSAETSIELAIELDAALTHPNVIFGYGRYGDGKVWQELDKLTGGLQELSFGVLAARPKVGKSMIAAAWVPYIARQALLVGKVVRVVTLEMSRKAYQRRMAAIMAGIKDPTSIKTGYISREEQREYRKALDELALLPIEYLAVEKVLTDEEAMVPGNSIITYVDVDQFIRRTDTGETYWWLLDHIGLLNDLRGYGEVHTSIYDLANKLARLAHTVATGLVITHLNRAAVGNSGVSIEHISGSDQVGKNGDQIFLLRRPWFEAGELNPEDLEAIKDAEPCWLQFYSRDEGSGLVNLVWSPRHARFDEVILPPGVRPPMPEPKKKGKR